MDTNLFSKLAFQAWNCLHSFLCAENMVLNLVRIHSGIPICILIVFISNRTANHLCSQILWRIPITIINPFTIPKTTPPEVLLPLSHSTPSASEAHSFTRCHDLDWSFLFLITMRKVATNSLTTPACWYSSLYSAVQTSKADEYKTGDVS